MIIHTYNELRDNGLDQVLIMLYASEAAARAALYAIGFPESEIPAFHTAAAFWPAVFQSIDRLGRDDDFESLLRNAARVYKRPELAPWRGDLPRPVINPADAQDRDAGPWDVFLSYSTVDQATVRHIDAALRARGIRPWRDERDLLPGHDFLDQLAPALRRCRCLALCLGSSGLGPWQREEVKEMILVLKARPGSEGCIIPVLLPGVDKPPPDLPFTLGSKVRIQLHSLDDAPALDRLAQAIRSNGVE